MVGVGVTPLKGHGQRLGRAKGLRSDRSSRHSEAAGTRLDHGAFLNNVSVKMKHLHKMANVRTIENRSLQPRSVRWVYIVKGKGKVRPLGLPMYPTYGTSCKRRWD